MMEAKSSIWFEKTKSKKRCDAYREENKRRVATYIRHDHYISVLDHMPNNSTFYESYQRLKGPKRPVKNLLCRCPFKRTFKPAPYATESANFYKFVGTDKGEKYLFLVHKKGYLPDPLSRIAPADRAMDGLFLEVFPQFRKTKNFRPIVK